LIRSELQASASRFTATYSQGKAKTMTLPTGTQILVRILALVLAGGSSHALAQNALGDGRGLEKDLRRGGTGNTPRKSMREEVAYRNALVTGQVGGGKSFRGDVGYTAPTDFRGITAEDSTYAFRRDSLSSKRVGQAVRGGEAIGYQFSYSTGNNRIVDRLTNRAISPLETVSRTPQEGRHLITLPDTSSLRSPSLYMANRDLRPSYVERVDMSTATATSSLLGIKRLPQEETKRPPNPLATPANAPSASAVSAATPASYRSSYDEIRQRLDALAGKPVEPKPAEGTDVVPLGNTPGPGSDSRPDPLAPPGQIGNQPGSRPGERPSDGSGATPSIDPLAPVPVSEWRDRIEKLRAALGAVEESAQRTTATGPRPVGSVKYVPGAWRENEREAERAKERRTTIDPETIKLIKQAGGNISAYGVGDTETGDPYAVHMRFGQRLLEDGSYFDAEERFSRALSYREADEMAQVGRIHSQIGAGLYLSAAINLQDLFTQRPELTAVRYAEGVVPANLRLRGQTDMLRNRLDEAASKRMPVPRDAALVLAYLGYQAEQPDSVRKGLDALEQDVSDQERNLLTMLRSVWLNEAPTASQAPAPAQE
jgi:hypothetical protein